MDIQILPAIEQAMGQGGCLAISISGGKDSEALLNKLAAEPVKSRPQKGQKDLTNE